MEHWLSISKLLLTVNKSLPIFPLAFSMILLRLLPDFFLGSQRVAENALLCLHSVPKSSFPPVYFPRHTGQLWSCLHYCSCLQTWYKFKNLKEDEILRSSFVLKPKLRSRGAECTW